MLTRLSIRTFDARRLLQQVQTPVDLVVTSPPYPMIAMWDKQFVHQDSRIARALQTGDGSQAFDRMHAILDDVWSALAEVVRPGGIVCVNIGDAARSLRGEFRLYPNHARILSAMVGLGFVNLPGIVWRKQTNAPNKFMGSGMLPAGAYVTLEHEHILVFRKGERRKITSAEDRHRRRESAFFWEERNSWFSDLWEMKGVPQRLGGFNGRVRSGAFPFEVAYRLVNMFSLRGDTVLDPFLGTGTTALAAVAAQRNCIGIEIEPGLTSLLYGAFTPTALNSLNSLVRVRMQRHIEFVRDHPDLRFRYRNIPHGFPVMTRQETGLRLEMVEEIHQRGEGMLEAFSRPLEVSP